MKTILTAISGVFFFAVAASAAGNIITADQAATFALMQTRSNHLTGDILELRKSGGSVEPVYSVSDIGYSFETRKYKIQIARQAKLGPICQIQVEVSDTSGEAVSDMVKSCK
ncbi:MAG TPA: hypothetical protein VN132_01960 [Bdellovibrio sp.]|nr:hypothetical protein [Bdellovibrio sp.]